MQLIFTNGDKNVVEENKNVDPDENGSLYSRFRSRSL